VTVKNEGDRAGKEVVQLYIHDLYASAVRPIQQLVAFEKIALEAGEERVVTFEVKEEMLRFYDLSCKLISEPGDFDLFVGHADHPVLTERFRLV